MRVSKFGGGKRTRNSCRSGTTFGRVSPHREPHARPVSARIRAQSCTGLACELTSGESYSIRTTRNTFTVFSSSFMHTYVRKCVYTTGKRYTCTFIYVYRI